MVSLAPLAFPDASKFTVPMLLEAADPLSKPMIASDAPSQLGRFTISCTIAAKSTGSLPKDDVTLNAATSKSWVTVAVVRVRPSGLFAVVFENVTVLSASSP